MTYYIYAGFDYKNRKNGYFKIGQTQHLKNRISNIQHYDSFQVLKYLEIDTNKSGAMLIESIVRFELNKNLTHTQNDHFIYEINSDDKYGQAEMIASAAMDAAKRGCEIYGIKYHEGTEQLKRK